MKFNKIILTTVLAISTFTYAGNEESNSSNIKENLYGTWNCHDDLEKDGFKMTFESKDTYVRNGRSHFFTTLKIIIPELPEIEYDLVGSATWYIDNGYLVETLDDIKVVRSSHPKFDEIIKLQDMFPKNISASSKILKVSGSKLSTKSESDGTVSHCTRKLPKS